MAVSTFMSGESDVMQVGRPGEELHVGHGALMDGIYRWQRHLYDATRKYYLLGRDRLIEDLRPGDGQTVLEVGCGTGRNLIKAARRYPQARLYGVDISEAMLETARGNIARAGLGDRITLVQGDAATFSAPRSFGFEMDRVFFSYALSMIPLWQRSLDAALDGLADQGSLHVVDFGQQEQLPDRAKAFLTWWLAQFHVEARAELGTELARAARESGRCSDILPLYRGYTWLGRIA